MSSRGFRKYVPSYLMGSSEKGAGRPKTPRPGVTLRSLRVVERGWHYEATQDRADVRHRRKGRAHHGIGRAHRRTLARSKRKVRRLPVTADRIAHAREERPADDLRI